MSTFKDYFGVEGDLFNIEVTKRDELLAEDVTEYIRKEGIKIKAIHPTRFGKEVVLFSTADAEKAAKIVGTKKIDGKSIFVEVQND